MNNSTLKLRTAGVPLLVVSGLVVLAILVWQGVTAAGNPDPTVPHLGRSAVILDTAVLVLREGLEAILVIAALTASFNGAQASYRRPVAAGVGVALLATVATWFVAVAILNAVSAPALEIQAVTGLLAIAVLLVVMNWFFHKIYWTGWISHHNSRRRRLLALGSDGRSQLFLGLGMLGFTAMYREGFEVVLFLQTLRLQAGSTVVLWGVALGAAFTAVVGGLTFVAHHKLPYKKMLILTGVMLGGVLVVMTGESVQELQQAGWLGDDLHWLADSRLDGIVVRRVAERAGFGGSGACRPGGDRLVRGGRGHEGATSETARPVSRAATGTATFFLHHCFRGRGVIGLRAPIRDL